MKTIVRHALLVLAFGLQCFIPRAQAAVAQGAEVPPPTRVYANCSWNHPGVNPFMGDIVAAVDRYQDIPPDVRARLKQRMEKREYDDLVSIRRDRIDGRAGYDYDPVISQMHFGTDQLCKSVTRTAWTPEMEERGLVYCENGYCLIIPTVCRNLSRISRQGVGDTPAAAPPLGAPVAEAAPPIDFFGPTGAGPLAAAGPLDGTVGGLPVGDAGIASGLLPGFFGGGGAPLGGIGGGGSGGGLGGGSGLASGVGGDGGTVAIVNAPGVGDDTQTAAVPEPGTWVLMLFGLGALLATAAGRSKSARAPA